MIMNTYPPVSATTCSNICFGVNQRRDPEVPGIKNKFCLCYFLKFTYISIKGLTFIETFSINIY